MFTDEHTAYTALSLALFSDYRLLRDAKLKHRTWQRAHEACQRPKPRLEAIAKMLESGSVRLIFADAPEFPESLRHIPFSPHALYVVGELPSATAHAVAIVGTRKATVVGLATARTFAKALAQHQIAIISGLALGIDATSHTGALEASGRTYAVLPCGLDTVYPRTNAQLAQRIIASGGGLISEYPPTTAAREYHFIERNRIVSGLSQAVLIIEAPQKSGTRATARFAIEQDKDVFVVPGAINNPNYEGSHELIQSGATLVTRPEDILLHFGIAQGTKVKTLDALVFDKRDKTQTIILTALLAADAPHTRDELLARTQCTAEELASALGTLEITGTIKEANGSYFIP